MLALNPGPLSFIAITRFSPITSEAILMTPLLYVYFTAFEIRLLTICPSLFGSPLIITLSSGRDS